MKNWFKNIFKKSNSVSNWIPYSGFSSGEFKLRDSEYAQFFIGWQYAAITAISDSISSLQFRLADKYDRDLKNDYLDLISPDLLGSIATFMKLCGTSYIWKITLGGKIIGLSILLPWSIEPVVDYLGNLVSWKYYSGGRFISLKVDEVLVFADFNPYQRYPYITRGYSPLQALAMSIKGEKEIEKWNYSLLTHDVPPGMILTTDQSLSAEQVRGIKEAWERNHTGSANVGKLAILPFGIKPSSIQSSPKEMEFISQQEWNRDKILAIYKVPKAVLGIGEGVNVGNVKAFNQIFSLRCIEPLSKKIARVFNDRLFQGIGTFEFLNVLPSDEEEVRQHYLSGGITKNEYRIELGYKPIIGGDVFVDGSKCNIERIKSCDIDYKAIVKRNMKQKFR